MKIKCIVSCRDASGVPTFFPCVVSVTKGDYDDGKHYEEASEKAESKGYENVGLVYDENDGPAFMFEHFWPAEKPEVQVSQPLPAAVRADLQIRDIMYRDGPDTQWSPDTLDEIAEVLRSAGLTPE